MERMVSVGGVSKPSMASLHRARQMCHAAKLLLISHLKLVHAARVHGQIGAAPIVVTGMCKWVRLSSRPRPSSS